MVKRLLLGIIKGVLLGGVLAALIVKGLGIGVFGAILAYVAAAITGALAGLLTGKPFWAGGAKVEATLKAVVGTLMALALMYSVRRWLAYPIDLTSLQLGAGKLGELPVAALPMVATVLSLFFELDNTPAPTDEKADKTRKRIEERKRVGDVAEFEDEELSADAKRAEQRR